MDRHRFLRTLRSTDHAQYPTLVGKLNDTPRVPSCQNGVFNGRCAGWQHEIMASPRGFRPGPPVSRRSESWVAEPIVRAARSDHVVETDRNAVEPAKNRISIKIL